MSEQSDTPRTDAAFEAVDQDCKSQFEWDGWKFARQLERALATATRERDEARAEGKRLLGVLLDQVPHAYEGNCPDRLDPTQRDPNCHACQLLAVMEVKP